MLHVEITQHHDGSWVQRTLSRVPKRMEHSGAFLMPVTQKDSYCFLLLKAPIDDFSYFTCIIPMKQVKQIYPRADHWPVSRGDNPHSASLSCVCKGDQNPPARSSTSVILHVDTCCLPQGERRVIEQE